MIDAFAQFSLLYRQIHAGGHTLTHCHTGVGRSGLLAAAVLNQVDRDAQQPFAHLVGGQAE